jgi:aminopeptidase
MNPVAPVTNARTGGTLTSAAVTFEPPGEVLERYAALVVGWALGGGTGIARGDVVLITAPDVAKPLYAACCRAVWRAGGHVLHGYRPADNRFEANLTGDFLTLAAEEQLDFFPDRYWRGIVDQADHHLTILADADPHALADTDPRRILRNRRARRRLREWWDAKENAGAFTWTIVLYGTDAMAAEAGMSTEEYWEQIIAGCYLGEADPAARWRQIEEQIQAHAAWLNSLPIDRLHVEGEDADLWVTLGESRRWLGGGGRNLPSFEIFTSPDWRGTEGWIRFSEPLYVYGSLITGIELEFREGRVIRAGATQNEPLLREMLASDGADAVGEFSLTDARLSPISRFMAETLYDENTGGPFGNTHLAVGFAIQAAYDGDAAAMTDEDWSRLGFNTSAVHTDIVSTTDRTVTAVMRDGSERVIYAGGRFQH